MGGRAAGYPQRSGDQAGRSEYAWLDAAVVAAATGPHLSALAGHRGWGHPLPFALISVCSYAVCAACVSVAIVITTRSVRREQRPDTQ
jgi:hypothetical protein